MNMITLLITVSNKEFLQDALLSIKKQNFRRFNLLVVVDISKEKVLLEYVVRLVDAIFENSEIPIEITTIEGNGTAAKVRNRGFEIAETEWITYMDDDDVITSDAIFEVNEAIKKYGEGFFASGYFIFDDEGKKENIEESIIRKPDMGLYYGEPYSINKRVLTSQLQVIRKKQWEKYRYVEDVGEDLDFVMHQLLMNKFFVIPKYLYGYRQRLNSYSRQRKIDIMTRRIENGYYYELFKNNLNNPYVRYNFFENREIKET